MTGSQQNATSSFVFPDDMTCSWCAHDTILTEQQLLDAVCRTDLCDQLHDLWVVVSAIAANDEEAAICAFGYRFEDACDEGLGVVWLLENLDLLP